MAVGLERRAFRGAGAGLAVAVAACACGGDPRPPPLDNSISAGGSKVKKPGQAGAGGAAGRGTGGAAGRVDGGPLGSGGSAAVTDGSIDGNAGAGPTMDTDAQAQPISAGDVHVIGPGNMSTRFVRVDSHGDIVVAGSTQEYAFDASGEHFESGYRGVFLAKYRGTDFTPIFQKLFRPPAGDAGHQVEPHAWCSGLALDAHDDIFIDAAIEASALDFGGGPKSERVVVKFSSVGDHVWTTSLTPPPAVRPIGPTIDNDGNVLVTFSHSHAFDFHGVAFQEIPFVPGHDYESAIGGIATLSSDGTLAALWGHRFVTPHAHFPVFPRPDATGRIAFAGSDLLAIETAWHGFYGVMNSAGSVVFEREIVIDSFSATMPNRLNVADVALVGDTLVLAGEFYGNLRLGNDVLSYSTSTADPFRRQSAFVAGFSATDGAHRWSRQIDTPFPIIEEIDRRQVRSARVLAMKDSSVAVLLTQTMSSDSPAFCGAEFATLVQRREASGTLFGQASLVGSPDAQGCYGIADFQDMAVAPDNTLVLLGNTDDLPGFTQSGLALVRVRL
jgi:hypothetical protein